MTDNTIENNRVIMIGEIVSTFEFSHEAFGEGFYLVDISVKRLSANADVIPLMVSERLIDVTQDYRGRMVEVTGQFRSYNRHEAARNKLVLSIFAREIRLMEEEEAQSERTQEEMNQIYLDGFVCKQPIYRRTPLGREIADILLAVNRPYGKSDYIPCIAWGRNAKFASGITVGTQVEITGRIQSRTYMKKLGEDQVEKRVAYEVSVSRISLKEETAPEQHTENAEPAEESAQ